MMLVRVSIRLQDGLDTCSAAKASLSGGSCTLLETILSYHRPSMHHDEYYDSDLEAGDDLLTL